MNRVVYANGRWWVFYDDGTNFGYRSSSDDGATWSSFTAYESPQSSEHAFWYDTSNNKLCMGITNIGDDDVHYRQGTPNTDGTITWDAAEQTVASSLTNPIGPTICKDSDGYPWIGYRANNRYYIVESTSTSGTSWNSPVELWGYDAQGMAGKVVSLTGGKLLAMCALGGDEVESRLYNGSSWADAVTASSKITNGEEIDAVADGDDVHCVFWGDISIQYDVVYIKYEYGTGWGE